MHYYYYILHKFYTIRYPDDEEGFAFVVPFMFSLSFYSNIFILHYYLYKSEFVTLNNLLVENLGKIFIAVLLISLIVFNIKKLNLRIIYSLRLKPRLIKYLAFIVFAFHSYWKLYCMVNME